MTTAATQLAAWIRTRTTDTGVRVDPLKLQKLAFYCYGCALGSGVAAP